MTPSPVSKEERRAQIIQAAIACFSKKGYHQTTMDDIVAASGLSKGSLYWHFKNKRDVLMSTVQWYFDQLAANLLPAVEDIPLVADRLRMLLAAFSQVMAEDDSIFRVFMDFYAQTRDDPVVAQLARDLLIPYLDMIAAQVQQGVENGEFLQVDARHISLALMASFDGLFLYHMMLGNEFDWSQIGREFSNIILRGLLAKQ